MVSAQEAAINSLHLYKGNSSALIERALNYQMEDVKKILRDMYNVKSDHELAVALSRE